MKQYPFLLAITMLLAFGTSASAQESATTTPGSRPAKTELLKEKRDAAFQEIKEKRTEFITESKALRADLQEKRKEMAGTLKESRAELEAKIKERREALRTEIQEIKKERVSVRKAFVEQRFEAAIKAIAAHQARVEGKIEELEADGYDLDAASDHLSESKDALKKASDLLVTLKATAVSDDNETTATKPRELAKQIEEQLKSARTHLMEAIKAIRAEVEPSDDEDEDKDDTDEAN